MQFRHNNVAPHRTGERGAPAPQLLQRSPDCRIPEPGKAKAPLAKPLGTAILRRNDIAPQSFGAMILRRTEPAAHTKRELRESPSLPRGFRLGCPLGMALRGFCLLAEAPDGRKRRNGPRSVPAAQAAGWALALRMRLCEAIGPSGARKAEAPPFPPMVP